MAESLPDLVARLKASVPALADVPDDVLAAEVVRQVQARGGPSVGDVVAAEPDTPTFRTSNEKAATGAAVVRDVSPWTKAATIGAPGIGERYALPSVGEILASDQPLSLLAQYVTGPGRPRSVANADPTGIDAFTEGKGPMPMFLGTVAEEVGGAGRGLYSRVDDAVSRLPAKGAHPNKIAGILKSNASAEELAYRQVPEFLAGKGNATVTPGDLQAHLTAHPAPMPAVKTLAKTPDTVTNWLERNNQGIPQTPDEWTRLSGQLERTAQGWQRNGDAETAQRFFGFAEDAGRHAEGVSTTTGSTAGQPKYAQYQLPGGEAYQETLLTLPEPGGLPAGWRTGPSSTDPGQIGVFNPAGDQVTRAATADAAIQQAQSYSTQSGRFRSSHFDEPNILVHTRSNTRTLPTGERGRFVEEVQSDWHQAGKTKGYQTTTAPPTEAQIDLQFKPPTVPPGHNPANYPGYWEAVDTRSGEFMGRAPGTHTREQALTDIRGAAAAMPPRGVPDAPFKETWPDLGLKQQLLEAAKDPNAQWLGFTSGQTQAARYDLSKQIDELKWYKHGDGYRIKAFKGGGAPLIEKQGLSESELAATVGKEMAQKIVGQTEQHGVMSGIDLQVGGEGMHHFYDELLPKRLQKIVKPFGGTVERAALDADNVAKLAAQNERYYERGAISEAEYLKRKAEAKQPTSAWIVRLTPAMKARIVKEGLPLGLLLGAAGPSVIEALGSPVSDHSPE